MSISDECAIVAIVVIWLGLNYGSWMLYEWLTKKMR